MGHRAWLVAFLLVFWVGCGTDAAAPGSAGAGGTQASGGSANGGTGASSTGGTGASSTGGTGASSTGGAAGSGATGGGASGAGGGGGTGGVWKPAPGTSWQWQLTGTIDTSVDVAMYDIDLFEAPQSVIDQLHAAGRVVICYFSAGSREDWRPDAGDFLASDYGNGLQGWPGENWLDVRSSHVRTIMGARLDLAVSKKCDGVEPDNVDGYDNATGFPLTEPDQIDYDQFLASEAHARGLSVGLKNALGLVPTLEPSFDWALNEECLAYSECGDLQPFLTANKAVFHVEYVDQQSQGAAKIANICSDASIAGFSTLVKLLDLDAWRLAC
jgi:Glycoside-hydrolase family GH114